MKTTFFRGRGKQLYFRLVRALFSGKQFYVRIELKYKSIHPKEAPCLIAEIGLNHNGKLELAKRQVKAAKMAGAHVAKFQLFSVESFIHPEARLGQGAPGSLQDFFRTFELSPQEWQRLADYTHAQGLDFLCSVFDAASLELYSKLEPRAIKIASCDLSNAILLKDIQNHFGSDFPILVSTGTCQTDELVDFMQRKQDAPALLMECVSAYPAEPSDYNLHLLSEWQTSLGCLVGLSDHSTGIGLSVASVALGACAIERHFTIDRKLPGPDQALSLEPLAFRRMGDAISEAHAALQRTPRDKTCRNSEKPAYLYGRRSLFASKDLEAGKKLNAKDVLAMRPGSEGLGPEGFAHTEGRILKTALKKGQVLKKEAIL